MAQANPPLGQSGDLAAAALEYAAAGWPVFPLQPRSKSPFAGSHAKDDGTTDPDVVRAMWTGRRLATIGARVPDDLVVLDVDPYHGGEETLAAVEAEHGPLPPTLAQTTGSGGRHLFFVHPGGRLHTPACFSPGVDLRVGGRHYIVLPPSLHASGRRYSWVEPLIPPAPMPGWLGKLLSPPAPRSAPPPIPSRRVGGYARAALAGEEAMVRMAPVGTRNHRLNSAAFSLGRLVGAGQLDLDLVAVTLLAAAVAAGLGETEARRTIASGLSAGQLQPRGRTA